MSPKITNAIRKEIVLTRSNKPRSRIGNNKHKPLQSENIPSFHEFMHRQQVKSQYRDFFKAIKMIDDVNARKSMENEVRVSYKRLAKEEDKLSISMAVKEGERRLKEFNSMVGYINPSHKDNTAHDADSWLNIVDEDDPRGRVGIEWPWDDDNAKSDKKED